MCPRTRTRRAGPYDLFTAKQAVATYERAEQWAGHTPAFAGKALPKTTAKLKAGAPLRLTVLGDSITMGGDASGSGFFNRPPMQPRYADLLAPALKKASGSDIVYTNISRGGTTAGWAVTMVPEVLKSAPDLVVVAFGMNDFGARTDADYKKAVAQFLKAIREKKPETEFVLVSAMWHNPYGGPSPIRFLRYQRDLKALCEPGVALADMTALFDAMLQKKRWHDIASCINHGNDFTHRLYAQTILGLLVDGFGKE